MKANVFFSVFIVIMLAGFFIAPAGISGADSGETMGDIEFLTDWVSRNAMPTQGLRGAAMFVAGKEEIPQGGTENIYFRLHDGGNRTYITVMHNTIASLPDGGAVVKSVIITDGGCILNENDHLGPMDGRPDAVCVNVFVLGQYGEVLETRWGEELPLGADSAEYAEIEGIFKKSIRDVKNLILKNYI